MPLYLRQSTATTLPIGPFVDATDGFTTETALTISQADIRLSKNGAAFAQSNNATGANHMENGVYSVPLDTTDTNTIGTLILVINESGARPVRVELSVLDEAVYDVLFGTAAPLVSGSNAGTTTFGALTVTGATTLTGNVAMAAGLTVTQSAANTSAVIITGTGTGDGMRVTGGATGRGIAAIGGGTSGDGLVATATSGHGIRGIGVGSAKSGIIGNAGTNASGISAVGDGTGHGLSLTAGASGKGLSADSIIVSGTTTLTGAVQFSSTFVVTGTTTLAALTTTGAVTFNSFTPNFNADVINATALAANAVTEIQSGLATAASIAALNNLSAAQVNAEVVDALATDIIADSVPADGTRPSISQAAYMILQFLTEASISGTTVTVKKVDGSTTLTTYTINSSTAPTSITRAT